jgi:hypothetical protein
LEDLVRLWAVNEQIFSLIYFILSISKWLGSNPSLELLTPNQYLVDFIDLSCIKQEEAIDSLHDKYEKYGLSLRELAAGSIHSRDTIAKRMKESGMVVRRPGRPKYALKKSVQYSQEDLYQLIRGKKDSGLTYRKIAQDLTALGAVCKKGVNQWHPMKIKRIIDHIGKIHK